MLHLQVLTLLRRVLESTKQKKLLWRKTDDQWYEAVVGEWSISIRFLNIEATNQVGADPRFIEVVMPSFQWVFAFGCEGAHILFEILGEADVGHRTPSDFAASFDAASSLIDEIE